MGQTRGSMISQKNIKLYITLQIITIIALCTIVYANLLPVLLAGLLIYNLVEVVTPQLVRIGIVPAIGKVITLIIISIIVIAAIALGLTGLASFFNGSSGGLVAMLQSMADTVATIRSYLPEWIKEYIPENLENMEGYAAEWLRKNAIQLSHIGRNIGVTFIYILMGMIIGGMMAYSFLYQTIKPAPLTNLLIERAKLINLSFKKIVFSQAKISLINTFFTGMFLLGVFPVFGVHLPFTKTMIIVTFVVGLLPVIGNLISNTVIVLICLSVSPATAFAALVFLVIIHKMEYFLNAHIIGSNISSRAWEILIAMIVMEALFGVGGLIAAPIYYAYLKEEFSKLKLI